VGIHHQVVPRESAVDRSLQVLRQGALVSEALKKPVVRVDTQKSLSQHLPLSHFPEELSLVLIECSAIG
jgi:hypothetical protein